MTGEAHGDVEEFGPIRGSRLFETTNWSTVAKAANADSTNGAEALGELCRTYWPPLYSFARYQGLPPADAEDLTQGFFEDLLSRGAIGRADSSRGRFRTFLLVSFKNFHSHQRAAAGRIKRGGARTFLSLETLHDAERRFQQEPANDDVPEAHYDRQWASSLLDRVLTAVRSDYVRNGKAALFDELKAAIWSGGRRVGHAELGRRLGMTEGAVKVAIHRLKRRFAEEFRSEVARTVLSPDDVDNEIRYLLTIVSR